MNPILKCRALLMGIFLIFGETASSQIPTQGEHDLHILATSLRTTGTYSEIVEASQIDTKNGDLQDIIISAFETHPRLKALRVQTRASRENIVEARSSYLPQIVFDSTASVSDREAELQNGSGFDQNTRPKSASLRLNQTLYNGGRRSLATQNAHLSMKASEAQYRASATAIAEEIINDYISLMSAEAELDVLAVSVKTLIDLEKSVLARRKAGDATRTEVAQASSRLAASRARRETARASLSNARARLLSKTGFLIQKTSLPKEALEPCEFNWSSQHIL